MYNSITLVGRLTKDVELRVTTTGKSVASFVLAVDRDYKPKNGEQETDFFHIVVWGNQAENCNKYLSKGKMALVNGRLQQRTYEDNNGIKRQIAEIIAEKVRFLSPKEHNNSQETNSLEGMPSLSDELPF